MAATLVVNALTDTSGVGRGLSQMQRQFSAFGRASTSTWGKIGIGIAAGVGTGVAGAIKAIGGIQDAQNELTRATGATGKELQRQMAGVIGAYQMGAESLQDVARVGGAVLTHWGQFTSVPEQYIRLFTDMERVTGLGGDALANYVNAISNAFGLSTGHLNELAGDIVLIGQETGVPLDRLLTQVGKLGPELQGVGLSAEQALAFVAQGLEAGQEAEAVQQSIRKITVAAQELGGEPLDVMRQMQEELHGSTENSEEFARWLELLGQDALPFIRGLQSGLFDLNAILTAPDRAGAGVITEQAEELETLGDKFRELGNQILAPLLGPATAFTDWITDTLVPAIDEGGRVNDFFRDIYSWLTTISAEILSGDFGTAWDLLTGGPGGQSGRQVTLDAADRALFGGVGSIRTGPAAGGSAEDPDASPFSEDSGWWQWATTAGVGLASGLAGTRLGRGLERLGGWLGGRQSLSTFRATGGWWPGYDPAETWARRGTQFGRFARFGGAVGAGLTGFYLTDDIIDNWEEFGALEGTIRAIAENMEGIGLVVAGLGVATLNPFIIAIGGAAVGVGLLYDNWNSVKGLLDGFSTGDIPGLSRVWNTNLVQMVADVTGLNAAIKAVQWILDNEFLAGLVGVGVETLKNLAVPFTEFGEWVADAVDWSGFFDGLFDFGIDALSWLGDQFTSFLSWLVAEADDGGDDFGSAWGAAAAAAIGGALGGVLPVENPGTIYVGGNGGSGGGGSGGGGGPGGGPPNTQVQPWQGPPNHGGYGGRAPLTVNNYYPSGTPVDRYQQDIDRGRNPYPPGQR